MLDALIIRFCRHQIQGLKKGGGRLVCRLGKNFKKISENVLTKGVLSGNINSAARDCASRWCSSAGRAADL